jgi:hypothetical protein
MSADLNANIEALLPPGDAPPFSIAWADDGILPLPTLWLWEWGIPVGAITVIAGKPGLGKSQLGVWLAAQLTRGLLPGEFHGKPKAVLVIATEDDWLRTVKPRLIAAGADLSRIGRITLPEQPDKQYRFSLDDIDLDHLRKMIEDHDIAMVLFDPMVSVMRGGDWNKAEIVRPQLEALQELMQETGCAAVGLMHFRKAFTTDIIDRIAGTGAYGQVIRAAIAMAPHPESAPGDNKVIVSLAKHNLSEGQADRLACIVSASVPAQGGQAANVSKIDWMGVSDYSAEEVLNGNITEKKQGAQARAKTWLEGYLREHGETLIEILVKEAQNAGLSDSDKDNTVRRLLRRAKDGIAAEGTWAVENRRETGVRNGKEYWRLVPVGHTEAGVRLSHPSHRSHPSVGWDGKDGKDNNSLSEAVPTIPSGPTRRVRRVPREATP